MKYWKLFSRNILPDKQLTNESRPIVYIVVREHDRFSGLLLPCIIKTSWFKMVTTTGIMREDLCHYVRGCAKDRHRLDGKQRTRGKGMKDKPRTTEMPGWLWRHEPSKHETFPKCCFDVGPPSSTSAQQQNNIGENLVLSQGPRRCRAGCDPQNVFAQWVIDAVFVIEKGAFYSAKPKGSSCSPYK